MANGWNQNHNWCNEAIIASTTNTDDDDGTWGDGNKDKQDDGMDGGHGNGCDNINETTTRASVRPLSMGVANGITSTDDFMDRSYKCCISNSPNSFG